MNLTKQGEEDFRRNILEYYRTLCYEIRTRFDFTNPILCEVHRIDPDFIFTDSESDQSVIPLLRHFPWCNNISTVEQEFRYLQYTKEAKHFATGDIDTFWYNIREIKTGDGEFMFGNISSFAKAVLCLPHSSAEVERIFSTLNNIKTKLQNRLDTKHVNRCFCRKTF